jgi:hypothetical protein
MVSLPTAIDNSRLPDPYVVVEESHEKLNSDFVTRFQSEWAAARAIDPTLPDYDVQMLETDPAMIMGQAVSYLRLVDLKYVNSVYRALLAPFATGSDLDAVVAARNIERLTVIPATGGNEAVMEGDAALLKRYLLKGDRASAGSGNRYLLDAYEAWPQSEDRTIGLWDAVFNGWKVHKRRGDTDVVIAGPFGAAPSAEQIALVRTAILDAPGNPEGVDIQVLAAERKEFTPNLVIEVANSSLITPVTEEATARVTAAALGRTTIGGEVPAGLLSGAAYGPGVLSVRDLDPFTIEPDRYSIPVMASLNLTVEVRT